MANDAVDFGAEEEEEENSEDFEYERKTYDEEYAMEYTDDYDESEITDLQIDLRQARYLERVAYRAEIRALRKIDNAERREIINAGKALEREQKQGEAK
jgi:hypothetical protein